MTEATDHAWPANPADHVWGPWMTKTGNPRPSQYRKCVHPKCNALETREAPRA